MAFRQAAIGADVRTSDGDSIGEVEHLIFDSATRRLAAVVADKGIFDSGVMVDIEYIAEMTEEAVTLKLTSEQAKALPGFVTQNFVQFGDATVGGVPVQGSGNTWTHVGPSGSQVPSTGATSMYAQPVVGEYATRTVGPMTESEIAISNDTHVETLDEKNIGNVDDILFDDEGNITGLIIEQGLVFHHDVHIPAEWIAGVTHKRVRLSVTKAQVEQSKK